MSIKKNKTLIKKIFLILLLILSLISFYLINHKNYVKLKSIKLNIVKHPENLPTKEIAKYTSFGFKNLKADLYWLDTIQYIGGNAINSEYKKYLYSILDIITELNPNFEHPYIIGELLLPSYNKRYEKLSQMEQSKNMNQAVNIGLKGIKNFCDTDKIKYLENKKDSVKLEDDFQFKNPCKSYKIPYNLAFIYYHYLKQPKKSSFYYTVASANDDAIEGAKIMAAIMKGKGGERKKAFFMFLNMASENEDNNKICSEFSKELIKSSKNINGKLILRNDSFFIKQIEFFRNKLFSKNKSQKISDNISCINYLNKAVREINLNYIELADKKFKEKIGRNSYTAQELFKEKYINFLPTDPQSDKDLNIIYFFNDETKHYDYKSGEYQKIKN